jgi:hypothetical protein
MCINEALHYIDMILVREHTKDEASQCRELFAQAYEATAHKPDSQRIVYPYSFAEARERSECSYYHASRNINQECVRAIDAAACLSCYTTHHYNLGIVAMKVLLTYGFNRVCAALAYHIQTHSWDGRLSNTNKEWANGIRVPDKAFEYANLNSHAILIDSLAEHVRKLYADLDADRFALAGHACSGEEVIGYAITHSIMVDDNQGYAIGHNPSAVSPWVCWQFYIRDDGKSYNWGIYGDEQNAIDGFNARVFVATNRGDDA